MLDILAVYSYFVKSYLCISTLGKDTKKNEFQF